MRSHIQQAIDQLAGAANIARFAQMDHFKDDPEWIRLGARAAALDDAVTIIRTAVDNDVVERVLTEPCQSLTCPHIWLVEAGHSCPRGEASR